MTWLAGPVFALALLVLGAGVAKLARPTAVVDALWQARLPLRRVVARPTLVEALGMVEIGVGAWAIAFGSRPAAAALAVLYVGFAAFAARLLSVSGANASCGCFGAAEAPVTRGHVLFTAVAAGLAALAVVWPVRSAADVLSHQPAWGAPFAVLTLLAAWLAEVLLTALPAALSRSAPSRSAPSRSWQGLEGPARSTPPRTVEGGAAGGATSETSATAAAAEPTAAADG